MNTKKPASKRPVIILIICVLTAVLLFAGYKIISQLLEYKKGEDTYSKISEYVRIPEKTPEQSQTAETPQTQPEPSDPEGAKPVYTGPVWPEVDFAALEQINGDIVGWLYCEGTPINYPVVQCSNNDYYLYRLFDETYNSSGCLFLDAANQGDFSDDNSIIYGHHMKNGAMFGSLVGYKQQQYYEEHPAMMLITPEKRYIVRPFAGVTTPDAGDNWDIAFSSEDERERWIDSKIRQSTFSSAYYPGPEDTILTLSTCTYEYDNARYLVFCALVEEDNLVSFD